MKRYFVILLTVLFATTFVISNTNSAWAKICGLLPCSLSDSGHSPGNCLTCSTNRTDAIEIDSVSVGAGSVRISVRILREYVLISKSFEEGTKPLYLTGSICGEVTFCNNAPEEPSVINDHFNPAFIPTTVSLTIPLARTLKEGDRISIIPRVRASDAGSMGGIANDYSNSITGTIIKRQFIADCQSGDPINLPNGAFIMTEKDISIPTRGLPLEFVRSYNNQNDFAGPLGPGWTCTYNTHLLFATTGEEKDSLASVLIFVKDPPEGAPPASSPPQASAQSIPAVAGDSDSYVILVDENNHRITFTKQTSTEYDHPAGIFLTLTKDIAQQTYQLKKKDGTRYKFNQEGKLISITDRNNDQTTLTYFEGRLNRVTDSTGRSLKFSYNEEGNISSLEFEPAQ